ncbi:MoxJ protein [Pseudomonas sp. ICMP 19500]|nr:MoxJ protein [Pseudomonas sp. ICMP 19500]
MRAFSRVAENAVAERDQLRAEVAGLRTGYEAYERVNAELKQKVANLEVCQTVSLGMSGIIKCVAGELGFDAAGEDSAQDYLIGLARRASELKAENEALRKERDARHPFKPLHEPSIGYTGCVICGVYTDHGGLPCPKTRATADAAMAKGQQS